MYKLSLRDLVPWFVTCIWIPWLKLRGNMCFWFRTPPRGQRTTVGLSFHLISSFYTPFTLLCQFSYASWVIGLFIKLKCIQSPLGETFHCAKEQLKADLTGVFLTRLSRWVTTGIWGLGKILWLMGGTFDVHSMAHGLFYQEEAVLSDRKRNQSLYLPLVFKSAATPRQSWFRWFSIPKRERCSVADVSLCINIHAHPK